MKILSAVQEIILNKSINNIVYEENLSTYKKISKLAQEINIDYWKLIAPPPANDSSQTTQDLAVVIKYANNRKLSDINLVYSVDEEPLGLFLPIMTKYNLSFPQKEFDSMYDILYEIVMDIKCLHNRARPAQLAKYYGLELDIIHTKTHRTPSYPSGHMAYGCLVASILADKYPEHSTLFWEIADQCGMARVLQGVHFPGDNEAALKLVQQLYGPIKTYVQSY
jgi:hypothetical protein